jgi:hypothetical protein
MPRASRGAVHDAVVSASEIASNLHHDLGPWERDSRLSAVSFCNQCGLAAHVYLGRLTEDDERRGGSTLSVPCTGKRARPSWSPANGHHQRAQAAA